MRFPAPAEEPLADGSKKCPSAANNPKSHIPSSRPVALGGWTDRYPAIAADAAAKLRARSFTLDGEAVVWGVYGGSLAFH
jgi:hypothetical protein